MDGEKKNLNKTKDKNKILNKYKKKYITINKKTYNLNRKKTFILKKISFIIPVFIIIISAVISLSLTFIFKKQRQKNLVKKNINMKILQQNFPSLRESFNNAKYFLDKCVKGIMMNNQTLKVSENPKVSAIITAHNCQDLIARTIISVQNQDLFDLEIIVINDYSSDNTLSIVEEIAKKDPRIKIIDNKKNMGIFYSRHIGVLSSKGEYIFQIDGDDMILDSDVFSTVTNIADQGDFDIITFRSIFQYKSSNILNAPIYKNYFSDYSSNLTLYQPEMGLYPFRPGKDYGKYDPIDSFLFNSCIRTSLYKKYVDKVGEERNTRYQIYEDDRTDIYALHNLGKSMRFIGKFGYLKIHNPSGVTISINKKMSCICKIYFLEICIDFSQDTFESKKVLVYFLTHIMELNEFEDVIKSNEYHKKLFISCMNRIISSKYIKNEDKEEIRKRASRFDFLNLK